MVELAFYSVDVFFFLGGFFAAFVLVRKLKNVSIGKLPIVFVAACILRWLRIMPSYAAGIFYLYKIMPFTSNAPLFSSMDSFSGLCGNGNWYKSLLFTDDFTEDWNGAYCFEWGWYLSNDF